MRLFWDFYPLWRILLNFDPIDFGHRWVPSMCGHFHEMMFSFFQFLTPFTIRKCCVGNTKANEDFCCRFFSQHTVRNLHFLSKNSTLISRENCRFFFLVKNSWKCCGFGLFSCWQLWFHEKNCQKKLGEKLVKMLWFWTF